MPDSYLNSLKAQLSNPMNALSLHTIFDSGFNKFENQSFAARHAADILHESPALYHNMTKDDTMKVVSNLTMGFAGNWNPVAQSPKRGEGLDNTADQRRVVDILKDIAKERPDLARHVFGELQHDIDTNPPTDTQAITNFVKMVKELPASYQKEIDPQKVVNMANHIKDMSIDSNYDRGQELGKFLNAVKDLHNPDINNALVPLVHEVSQLAAQDNTLIQRRMHDQDAPDADPASSEAKRAADIRASVADFEKRSQPLAQNLAQAVKGVSDWEKAVTPDVKAIVDTLPAPAVSAGPSMPAPPANQPMMTVQQVAAAPPKL